MISVLIPATGRYYPIALKQAIALAESSEYQPIILSDDLSPVPTSIKKAFIEHRPWPLVPLRKFEYMIEFYDMLQGTHVLIHDADTLVKTPPPGDFFTHELFCVEHPGFLGILGPRLTLERNPKSTAFIDRELSTRPYVMGAVIGGDKSHLLDAAKVVDSNIKNDLNNGIMPIWHDESHWNAYLYGVNSSLIKFSDYNRYFRISDKGGMTHKQIRAWP